MDSQYPITDQLNLIAAQARLLADLTVERDNLQGVATDALALVIQDLAARLERLAEASEDCGNRPLTEQWEGRS